MGKEERREVCVMEKLQVWPWGSVPLRISARIQIVTALPTPVSPGLLAAGGGTRVPQLAGESRQAESQCMHLEVLGSELFGRQGLPWPLCPS